MIWIFNLTFIWFWSCCACLLKHMYNDIYYIYMIDIIWICRQTSFKTLLITTKFSMVLSKLLNVGSHWWHKLIVFESTIILHKSTNKTHSKQLFQFVLLLIHYRHFLLHIYKNHHFQLLFLEIEMEIMLICFHFWNQNKK